MATRTTFSNVLGEEQGEERAAVGYLKSMRYGYSESVMAILKSG